LFTTNAALLHKVLSVDDRNEWEDVRTVVIDEVSFMSDTILKTLDIDIGHDIW
jgi:hypothetical protein